MTDSQLEKFQKALSTYYTTDATKSSIISALKLAVGTEIYVRNATNESISKEISAADYLASKDIIVSHINDLEEQKVELYKLNNPILRQEIA
ncbi:MAG: hypothetical protein LBQ24_06010 [Candidatus Peribacteria bacterium]|nr:hypothetical protein [Candidatus Peribacteria bacterium]